jgi:hypothetical protein
MKLDLSYVHRVWEDDTAFFERLPDREFRIRRAHDCEYTGEPPPGVRLFVILHRHDVEQNWQHKFIARPVHFNIDLTDAQIRELLQVVA